MFLLLTLLWIVFNGRFTIEVLLFGVAISGLICFFLVRFFGYSFRKELRALKILPDLIIYIFVLLIEIIKANFTVMKLILFKAREIEPVVVHFHTDLKSRYAKVLLANSITLTPGTITSSMHDDEYYVHCLDKKLGNGISDSVFVRRLKKMEAKL
ncbi:MAG: Na+/H+ antiporter subunit E [Lachnospiraceae bacterium]|nr:Na+/H+ antiporter subunit E [Lachnospiraceae bacterium]